MFPGVLLCCAGLLQVVGEALVLHEDSSQGQGQAFPMDHLRKYDQVR